MSRKKDSRLLEAEYPEADHLIAFMRERLCIDEIEYIYEQLQVDVVREHEEIRRFLINRRWSDV